MEKDVIISIHSIQDLSSDEPQVIDFMTLGKYRKDGEVARQKTETQCSLLVAQYIQSKLGILLSEKKMRFF